MERDKKGRFVKGHKWVGKLGVNTRLRIDWKNCLECDKLFYVDSKNRKNRFCSISCGCKYNMRERKKRKGFYKGKEIPCETCKKIIYVEPNRLRNNKHYFCSKKCFYKFRKGWSNEKMREALDRGRHNQKGMPKFTEEMKKKQSIKKKKDWSDLEKRKEYMKHRTPEKLKKFREGHKKYLEENKGNLPISKIKNNRVIDKILK